MIFGSVINDNLKDEIVVTVIATGFNEEIIQPKPTRPALGQQQQKPVSSMPKREPKREEAPPQEPTRNTPPIGTTRRGYFRYSNLLTKSK